jgi:hypothetical protein
VRVGGVQLTELAVQHEPMWMRSGCRSRAAGTLAWRMAWMIARGGERDDREQAEHEQGIEDRP